MIDGKIITIKVEGGGFLYKGHCIVTGETVTASDVMAAQLPDMPKPIGKQQWVRKTLRWDARTNEFGESTCVFEVLDTLVKPRVETVEVAPEPAVSEKRVRFSVENNLNAGGVP